MMISYCGIGGLLLCLWGLEGVLLGVGSHKMLADMPGSATIGLPVGHGYEGCLPEIPPLCCHSDTRSSLMAIDCDSSCLDHGIQNQWGADQAPQPHEPDASVNKCLSGDFKRRNWCTDVPGQCSRRESHQASSERAARLRRSTLPGLVAKRALRNALPSGKTVAACTRWPTRDSSAYLF